jgi:hypothetical protein
LTLWPLPTKNLSSMSHIASSSSTTRMRRFFSFVSCSWIVIGLTAFVAIGNCRVNYNAPHKLDIK